jgi:hypothetical protein
VRFLPLFVGPSGNRTISSPSCSPVAVAFLRAQCGAVLIQTCLVLRALLRRSDLALPRGSGRITGQCGERFFVVVWICDPRRVSARDLEASRAFCASKWLDLWRRLGTPSWSGVF